MKFGTAIFAGCLALTAAGLAPAQEKTYYDLDQKFSEMTAADQTAAKDAALHQQMRPLTACADPANMPFSDRNGDGIDNQIVQVLAKAMHTTVRFYWMSYLESGFVKRAFGSAAEPLGNCDLVVDIPDSVSGVLMTDPIYRSTYVFAYGKDSGIHIKSLTDPALKKLRVGVYETSAVRQALAENGIKNDVHVLSVSYDTESNNGALQQWRQVEQVLDGKLDVVGTWGPFAAYAQVKKHAPIVLQPVNLMSNDVQLEYAMAIGVRENDVVLKYALDNALDASADKIKAILDDFGVPLVQCSECVVQGNLPSHGPYSMGASSYARYQQPLDTELIHVDTSQTAPGETVTLQDIKKSLAAGADRSAELAQAVVASDAARIKFLAAHGADLNARDSMGATPLTSAAGARDSDTVKLLLQLGADANASNGDGVTPLMAAAQRDHVPSVEALLQHGASLTVKDAKGLTPLCGALENRSFLAATTLLNAGASPNAACGANGLTPLMIVATHLEAERSGNVPVDDGLYLSDGVAPQQVGKLLVSKGADANARSKSGLTALMVAAGHDNAPLIGLLIQAGAKVDARSDDGKTALDIAKENGSDASIQTLDVMSRFAPVQSPSGAAAEPPR
ncbi:quinoprotein dehydrogenase-associated probable ABC transporter substrate-binding protein [Rhodanobacter sp. ANJX3]|uniref:quinoprotein dehydrogenase-associated putative ABC transporter substrate-binding protein n=1 Tax=Rhodanobacter sp. ANJX3 TaxID=2723083 RepID=UPI00160E0011|nr:quinoprotein dehydrogenase-associated putative ABC transporter substrate-binding protein [Rhodanobacter sp. ANJX3]MBB5359832.1 quinoprotein dehydrogenase-associated probable ABC transporter substrate-binding protein [Rhodanobacter sp. ANJX3]